MMMFAGLDAAKSAFTRLSPFPSVMTGYSHRFMAVSSLMSVESEEEEGDSVAEPLKQ